MWANSDCFSLSITCLQLMAGQTLDGYYAKRGWDTMARPLLRPCFHGHGMCQKVRRQRCMRAVGTARAASSHPNYLFFTCSAVIPFFYGNIKGSN